MLKLRIYSIFVFAIMLYYILLPLGFRPLTLIYYASVPLTAAVLSLRRFKGPTEAKLLLLFGIWFVISRFLNGNPLLEDERHYAFGFFLSAVVFELCSLLKPEAREKFLLAVAASVTAFYSILSCCGIYTAVSGIEFINPINSAPLAGFNILESRLSVLNYHPNTCAVWFFMALCMAIYLLLHSKKILWRIISASAALLNHAALALTQTRTMKLAFALCFALLLSAVALKYRARKKLFIRIAAALLLICLLTPLLYDSFNLTRSLIGSFARTRTAEITEPPKVSALETVFRDERGFDSNGRFFIYQTVVPTLQQEPMRLLRGCLYADIMSISNSISGATYAEFHNALLQTLVYTGLPGLLLILAFLLLLVIKMLRLFFSEAPLHVKTLLTILAGTFVHNMFEASLFMYTDIRSQLFFLTAGAVMAYTAEYAPKKGLHA